MHMPHLVLERFLSFKKVNDDAAYLEPLDAATCRLVNPEAMHVYGQLSKELLALQEDRKERISQLSTSPSESEEKEMMDKIAYEMKRNVRACRKACHVEEKLMRRIERCRKKNSCNNTLISSTSDRKLTSIKKALAIQISKSFLLEHERGIVEEKVRYTLSDIAYFRSRCLSTVSSSGSEGYSPTHVHHVPFKEGHAKLTEARQSCLERAICNLPSTVPMKHLMTDLELCSSQVGTTEAVEEQLDLFLKEYREALYVMRTVIKNTIDNAYSIKGTQEFVVLTYPLALKANRIMHEVGMQVQPEMRRLYKEASVLTSVEMMTFPESIQEASQPGQFEKNRLKLISSRTLREGIVEGEVLLHGLYALAIKNITLLENWKTSVHNELLMFQQRKRELTVTLNTCTAVQLSMFK